MTIFFQTRPAASGLVSYAEALPVSSNTTFSCTQLVEEIVQTGKNQMTNNNVYVPVLQTLHALLKGGVLAKFGTSDKDLATYVHSEHQPDYTDGCCLKFTIRTPFEYKEC